MKIKFYILFIFLISNTLLNSQIVEFDKVLVNNKIADYENQDIVLSDKDSVTFYYFCKTEQSEQTPFLFRVLLSNGLDSAVKTWNEPIIQYTKLPEGRYEFQVSAFDLKKNWTTNPKTVKFRVNNFEARLLKDIEYLNEIIESQDSVITKLKNIKPETNSSMNWLSIIGGFLGASLIFTVLFIFLRPGKKGEENDDVKRKFHRLELENNNLKAELGALRSQIEGLQRRTEDMRYRNKELEESVKKLIVSKEELETLQSQKDELFAMLIHDIKNPAGIIKSLVELLRSYDLSAIDQQGIIDDILNTTKVIVQLSQEVSRVLALEGGKLNMDFKEASLVDISKRVYDRFKIKAKEKNITLMYDVPDGLPDVKLDEGKIDEVVSNLLSNAIKFTQKGGSVRLKVQQIDDTIVFEISDNGLGLSEDDLNNAFKRGAQLSAKPTGGESSTGLGLWIVKKLVEAHNGRVWVRSSLGKGSTFAFSLPVVQLKTKSVVHLN